MRHGPARRPGPARIATCVAVTACLLAAPARAAEPEPGIVSTQATARDRLPNTVADVSLGIEAHGRTLADVQRTLTANSTKLVAYLRTTAAERTRTEAVQLSPDLDPNPARGQPPRVVGYSGTLTVAFRIEAGTLGAVLAEALAQGANTIDSTVLRPREAELDGARQRLAAAATRIALDQARAVAEAAGRRTGMIRGITVDAAPMAFAPRPLMARAEPAMAMPAPPPMGIAAGDTEIMSSVHVAVALIEP